MTTAGTVTDTLTTAPGVVDRFLAAVERAAVGADLYTPDAVLDATVPNWRFSTTGADAIATEYGRWFNAPGRLVERRRQPTPAGEVVEYVLTWEEGGVRHAGHHVHVLDIDAEADRIRADHVWCGGRWPQSLLAQMPEMAEVGAEVAGDAVG